ncbi:heme NO-binding domain-containing protein [Aliamphritea ceti]|uniref:heme NO-binding domain-containing protein n=1 Tax=Aliamphritea ceti TaxID=1524258 RepID=UPI0021C35B99|nr:heme NO-binding domain-containing protein [Aliamphritea ceti]
MKGVIFNILEEMVIDKCGMMAWNDILDKLGQDGVYTAGKSYPDDKLFALVGEVSARLELPAEAVVGAFGEFLFDQLARRYPVFLETQATLKDFLKSIDSVIHVEVRKLYESPDLPTISYREPEANTLVMEYRSPRQLCLLAEGLIRGAASRYKESIEMTHPVCTHQGADHCDLIIKFNGPAS